MQHSGCDEIQLLISRFVDDEVTQAERERVETHVGTCDACAYKLIEYMEMAVIFAEGPLRSPEPELRSSVFREIGNAKEAERSKTPVRTPAPSPERPWYTPAPAPRTRGGFFGQLVKAVSPLAVASLALFMFLGALALGGRWPYAEQDADVTVLSPPRVPIPTRERPLDSFASDAVPGPEGTKVSMANPEAVTPSQAYVQATATLGRDQLVELTAPTPVFEEGSAADKDSWHDMRDPSYGYKVSYPPNWWTRLLNNTRFFYPWSGGGTRYAPYWIDLRITPNSLGLTVETGNSAECGGDCEVLRDRDGKPVWLRRTFSDAESYYDEGYMFDRTYVYRLRLNVPRQFAGDTTGGDFSRRIEEASNIFSLMSGRIVPVATAASSASAYGGVLFLDGSDLMLANTTGAGAHRITSGAGVKHFALSPDMSRVAFTASSDTRDIWGKDVYVASIGTDGPAAPMLLISGMSEVHDVAWYSDREVLFIARDADRNLRLYRLSVPMDRNDTDSPMPGPELLANLGEDMVGARGLAVSPDRQLITFLAPVGGEMGTDIYGVRPDGTDLMKLISHLDAVPPTLDGKRVLAPDSQAIKSYKWTDGRLEAGGYAANILFTCGNSDSPSWTLGGFLYSAPGHTSGPAVDPFALSNFEPERVQIVNVAYSEQGKVAFTGYRRDIAGRAYQLDYLWTADLVKGSLVNITEQPIPDTPNGITDLEWTPDGTALVYRETIPSGDSSSIARYDGELKYHMVKLDLSTKDKILLYDGKR
jgi:hypothetical protein